ncbi:MAG: nucleotidyl transferase AbiEii/AbiGii toxin family protein [Pleomorphochaeta sp.]
MKGKLALKGGTAINLTNFNLPRLSVDIDLDYLISNNREQMLLDREIINKTIHNYLLSEGYYYNPKSKSPYSLDSWVYNFKNTSGNKDSIKIEINYSLRSHVLESKDSLIVNDYFSEKLTIKILDPLEIYAS